jgi:hypothetical protein
VERNARIIKWLYTCKKAKETPSQELQGPAWLIEPGENKTQGEYPESLGRGMCAGVGLVSIAKLGGGQS